MPTTRHQATLEKDETTDEMTIQTGEKRKDAPTAEEESQPTAKAAKVEEKEPKQDEASPKDHEMEKDDKNSPKDHEMEDASTDHTNGDSKEETKAETKEDSKPESNGHTNGHTNGKSVEEKKADAQAQGKSDAPSNVATDYSDEPTTLEHGIVYFFFRPRVEIKEPESLNDVQRGYLILRPLADGEKVANGPLKESKNLRLIAIPKKALPSKGGRVLSFVQKGKTSTEELRETFLHEITNETKTMGTRHTGTPIPICEGVYSLIHTKNTTYLVYITTAPANMGPVQEKFGIHNEGSFAVSVRNPSFESPPYARLPETANYPKELIEEFQGLRWLPLHSKHLDYDNCEILIIGESKDKLPSEQKAADGKTEGKNGEGTDEDLEKAEDELKELEGMDESRIEHLKNDHAVFEDLKLSAKDYPDIMTQWD